MCNILGVPHIIYTVPQPPSKQDKNSFPLVMEKQINIVVAVIFNLIIHDGTKCHTLIRLLVSKRFHDTVL